MNVLIIEDEKAAARNLSVIIAEIDPSICIVGIEDSVVGSVEWFTKNPPPDLIFADIHLADGSAFDIFDRCTIESPVIFTTAYDEYAIRAFKVNSIDYLLKPISESELHRAIEKFTKLSQRQEEIETQDISALIRAIRPKTHQTHLLIPKDGDRIIPLAVESIVFFNIEDGIVRATTKELKAYVVPYTLDQLTEIIDPALFFRANRQYIISRGDIAYIELWFAGRLSIKLKSNPEAKIMINKPRVSEFKAWLTGMRQEVIK